MRTLVLMASLAAVIVVAGGCGGKGPGPQSNMVEDMVREGDTDGLSKIIATPGVADEALKLAAIHDKADMLPFLVDNGADIKRADADGMTPLHWAAGAGSMDAAKALLARGAAVNARNLLGQTPLDYAAEAGKTEMVAYLKGVGGKPGPDR
jgi:ankyrin repeat protein